MQVKGPQMSNQKRDQSPLQSLRNFLTYLDQRGELIHIRRRVNPRFELAAVVQNIQDSVNKAVFFENVEGFRGSVASNVCGSYENIALALSSDLEGLANAWATKSEGVGVFPYERFGFHEHCPIFSAG